MVSLAFLGTEISSGFEAYHVVAIHMDECMDACMHAWMDVIGYYLCVHMCVQTCLDICLSDNILFLRIQKSFWKHPFGIFRAVSLGAQQKKITSPEP